MDDILLYFSLKYKGNWMKIYEAIRSHEVMDEDEFKKLKEHQCNKYITYIGDFYP